jgi:GAF domain-containing protein/ActR/RegA family two-component response regulator
MAETHQESRYEESLAPSAERSAEKPRLLVVTADDALGHNLVSTLSAIYCVGEKPTAEHALSSLGQEPSDLVIASFNLPGAGGLELVRQVQSSYPDTGVMLMSLQPSVSEAAQAFRVGALAYLPAPFKLRDVLNAIEEALQELKTRRQSRRAEAEKFAILERMQKHLEQLRALQEVGRMLNADLAPEEIMAAAFDQAMAFSGAERGGLLLADDDGQFTLHVARGMDQSTIDEESFAISRTIIQRVFRSGLPLLTSSAREDPELDAAHYQLRSILCVPLLCRERPTGVIYLDNSFETGKFDEEHLELVRAIADRASMALENARLNREAQQQAQWMEERVQEMAERLVKAERLAAIGEITVAVRHEINNPLTSLLLQVELLQEAQTELPAEVRQGLEYIHGQCQRIADVMRRLLSVQDRPVHYTTGVMMTDLSGSEEEVSSDSDD